MTAESSLEFVEAASSGGHSDVVTSIQMTHDGYVVSGSRDQCVRVYSFSDLGQVAEFRASGQVRRIIAQEDGTIVVATDSAIQFLRFDGELRLVNSLATVDLKCIAWSGDRYISIEKEGDYGNAKLYIRGGAGDVDTTFKPVRYGNPVGLGQTTAVSWCGKYVATADYLGNAHIWIPPNHDTGEYRSPELEPTAAFYFDSIVDSLIFSRTTRQLLRCPEAVKCAGGVEFS